MAKKTPAQKTWTPQAEHALVAQYLKNGGTPTQQMIDKGYVKANQTPNPPAQPFLTGDQIVSKVNAGLQHGLQVQDLNDQLATAVSNAQESRYNIENSRARGVEGAQDDAAARGIFQSSIKDGQIFDINAQAAHDQQRVTDQLTALQSSVATRVNMLDEALRQTNAGFDTSAVQNASSIDTGDSTGYSLTNKGAAPQPAAGAPAKPGAKPQYQLRYTGGLGKAPGYRYG